ncbi:DUF6510 family protein [Yinghuangia soli]|uniref:DUF6510 family protein n=1 Tax=Yinghuangia soli TaxID=2908204 RepID=A0AA41Q4M4_9ACTN|nr:DUF6510 family protein [Yinghuangia soli]MCF2531468.1 DUF6510 family protein [Yinghuangia soli]
MPLPTFRDGNVLAGPLSGVFAADVTAAWLRCPDCGCEAPVAALCVYDAGPGAVARCAGCDRVALRVARQGDTVWVDFGGGGALRFTVPDGP